MARNARRKAAGEAVPVHAEGAVLLRAGAWQGVGPLRKIAPACRSLGKQAADGLQHVLVQLPEVPGHAYL